MNQKGQTGIFVLAGIIILIVVAGGIFYLGRIIVPKSQTPVATSQPTPSPTDASPAPTSAGETVYTESDRSANWKTYTNTKYKFSLRYPSEWKIKEGMDNTELFSIESPDYKYDADNRVAEEVKVGAKVFFLVLNSNNYTEPQAGEVPTQYFDTINNKQVTATISNISKLQIAGRNATKYDKQRQGKYPLMEVIVDIHEGAMIYQLRMMYASTSLKEIFNQILSTFRFIQ